MEEHQGISISPNTGDRLQAERGIKRYEDTKTHGAPLRLLVITIVAIFVAEVAAMIVVYFLEPLPYHLTTLVDAGIMVLLIFPVLYFFSFRPLIQQMKKSWEAEERLRTAHDELEARVQSRTKELSLANFELGEEINERRRVEKTLRETEKRSQRAEEIAHLGSWELDLVNDRLIWSDEVYKIFGRQPQEFAASYEAFLATVHPDDRAAVDHAYTSSVQDGQDGYEIEHRVIRQPSSEIRIVHEKCEHFRNEAGEIIRSGGMVHDITERKKAEEALRLARDELELRVQERTQELAVANRELLKEIAERKEIEQQLRLRTTAMEAAANGIVITDSQGNIQWTNPTLLQMSGYEADELIGQNMRIFKSDQQDASYYGQMWNTILSGQVWQSEVINRRKDGSLYVEAQTITPVLGDLGEISQFIAIKQDITEHKQAEKDLEERNLKEKILTETIHTMQLDIARDLHDTIGQNIGFLRMKLDYLAEKPMKRRAEMQLELQSMVRAANESYDLIRGTLAVLQSENSSDLFRLFTRYAEQIQERSAFKIEFSTQGEPRFMSARRMRQLFYVFREILSNIEKHSNASQILIEMTWEQDCLLLVVRDDGSGFDMEKVQYGSHYGLKFMRERVELLNGSLSIRSGIGSGTKITLEVPYT